MKNVASSAGNSNITHMVLLQMTIIHQYAEEVLCAYFPFHHKEYWEESVLKGRDI